jgi:hypothetical protein
MDDPVQELDLIVRAGDDGRWVICQRRGSSDAMIRGPFQNREQAVAHSRVLKRTIGADAFVETEPGVFQRL